jgi:phage portal protein BeeE
VLATERKLTEDAHVRLRESLKERHTTPGGRHQTLILEEGLKWEALGFSHEDSQFIESRRFTT